MYDIDNIYYTTIDFLSKLDDNLPVIRPRTDEEIETTTEIDLLDIRDFVSILRNNMLYRQPNVALVEFWEKYEKVILNDLHRMTSKPDTKIMEMVKCFNEKISKDRSNHKEYTIIRGIKKSDFEIIKSLIDGDLVHGPNYTFRVYHN
jgi:hypothetical protein